MTIRIQIALLIFAFSMQACAAPAPWQEGQPKHHTTEGFRNYPVLPEPASLGVAFYLRRIQASFNPPVVPESHYLQEQEAIARLRILENKPTITWIGQSTLLLNINGKTILTDPYFSQRVTAFQFGPERFVKPGISAKNLPVIDVIVVSHNHYDHLNAQFIESLQNRENIHVFVPLKLKRFFIERGYRFVHELDWYESVSVYDFQFTALPSVHYSGRGAGDRNETLWNAWAIETPVGRYFFLGDSAYSPTLFKEIGQRFDAFDLAIVPIGTYGNRKYGVNNHTTPEEAVTIGKEIQANALLGVHWGTIDLSDEDPWEPPRRFEDAARKENYSADKAWLLKIGETRLLP